MAKASSEVPTGNAPVGLDGSIGSLPGTIELLQKIFISIEGSVEYVAISLNCFPASESLKV